MKHLSAIAVFWLLAAGLLGAPLAARASHLLGAELTYTALGSNQYRVKLRAYQDCSSILASIPLTLLCRQGGCTTPATVTAQLVQQGAVVQPAALCASAPASCQNPSSQYALFNITTYEATVTLLPGQWTLSTAQSARPTLANVLTPGGSDLYVDAYLDSSGSNVANSAPQLDADDVPVQYVCVNQRTTLGFSGLEPDGDSVVYSMATPLQGCSTPVAYSRYPGTTVGTPIIIRTQPLCVLEIPALMSSAGLFSAMLPLPVGMDTLGVCPIRQGAPLFHFNQEARTVTFTPNLFTPTAGPTGNKYLLAVQAEEYRRVGGVMRLVGRTRHEMAVVVMDCGTNTVPSQVVATSQTANAGTRTVNTADSTTIDVLACSYSRVALAFSDPNNQGAASAHQLLTVTVPADLNSNPQLLAAGDVGTFTLTGNGTEQPRGTFFFQPSPGAVGRTIRVNVRIEDNNCPVKARQNRVIVIHVRRAARAMATALGAMGSSTSPQVYPGDTISLLGQLARPDSVRHLATNSTAAQTYAYLWRGAGLAPAGVAGPSIRVVPAATSRYYLAVTPQAGVGASCGDTTSVLVRVLPQPVPTPLVQRNGAVLTSSAPTGNQWYLNGQPIAGATSPSLTATAPGTYTVRATVQVGNRSYTTPMSAPQAVLSAQHALPNTSLTVAPNPTPDGRVRVQLAGYAEPVALTVLDALGRAVSRTTVAAPGLQRTATVALDLGALPAGLYLLRVQSGAGLEIRRIVRE